MRFLEAFWRKRESFSAHFAWGMVVVLWGGRHMATETAFVLAVFVAAGWELVGELVTRARWNDWVRYGRDDRPPARPGLWLSRALDIVPWVLGAGLAWIIT